MKKKRKSIYILIGVACIVCVLLIFYAIYINSSKTLKCERERVVLDKDSGDDAEYDDTSSIKYHDTFEYTYNYSGKTLKEVKYTTVADHTNSKKDLSKDLEKANDSCNVIKVTYDGSKCSASREDNLITITYSIPVTDSNSDLNNLISNIRNYTMDEVKTNISSDESYTCK